MIRNELRDERLQHLSVDFSSVIFGEGINEFDPARVFVNREVRFDEGLKFLRELIVSQVLPDGRSANPISRALAAG